MHQNKVLICLICFFQNSPILVDLILSLYQLFAAFALTFNNTFFFKLTPEEIKTLLQALSNQSEAPEEAEHSYMEAAALLSVHQILQRFKKPPEHSAPGTFTR